jgi:HAD superfamily hydrolase (TIGR01484 family)
MEAPVLDALFRLQSSGLLVIPITGRPAGWCDLIARMWPVDAVVGENGAFYFSYDHGSRRMERRFVDDTDTRAENRRRLDNISKAVLTAVPNAALAADQAYRETDLAIDFAEDVGPLNDSDIDKIVDLFHQHGATAKVSSIHVNGWFGTYDKLTMTKNLMTEVYTADLTAEQDRYVFVGDSPNDAPMFGFFDNAVGVANVRPLAERCDALPRWITSAPRGAGFCEVAEALLSVR